MLHCSNGLLDAFSFHQEHHQIDEDSDNGREILDLHSAKLKGNFGCEENCVADEDDNVKEVEETEQEHGVVQEKGELRCPIGKELLQVEWKEAT